MTDLALERPDVLGSFGGEERRVARVPIHRRALASVLREDVEVVDGIPRDSEVLAIRLDHERDELVAIVESEEFDLVDLEAERPDVEDVVVEARELDPADVATDGGGDR